MNKSEEKFYVEWFVNKIGWKCNIVADEAPDFKIEFSDKTIGLEVTGLFKKEKKKGSPVKTTEALRSAWLSAVSKEYYQLSNKAIEVEISIQRGELDFDHSLMIDELITKSNIKVGESIEYEFEPHEKCLLNVWIDRLPDKFSNYDKWSIIENHVGLSQPLYKEDLLKKIKGKAFKLEGYKQKYSEIILLIVANQTYESGMFHPNYHKLSIPNLGFSHVYLALYPTNYFEIC